MGCITCNPHTNTLWAGARAQIALLSLGKAPGLLQAGGWAVPQDRPGGIPLENEPNLGGSEQKMPSLGVFKASFGAACSGGKCPFPWHLMDFKFPFQPKPL